MTGTFLALAAIAATGAAAAMLLRNAVHCVLALTVGLAGLAGLYLELGAQFVGFTQVLVYVGAVAILAVFAIMMTQGGNARALPRFSTMWAAGGVIAAAVFAVLAWAIRTSGISVGALGAAPSASVQEIGDALVHRYVLPLEIAGVLLTAALIGAVVLAMPERTEEKP
ncbi:MAG: NADH-quinone oxidoreductase subunit J [Acidobacteriaceae bacterium]